MTYFFRCCSGNLPDNVTLSHSAKFVPGDPFSPYVEDLSLNGSYGNSTRACFIYLINSKHCGIELKHLYDQSYCILGNFLIYNLLNYLSSHAKYSGDKYFN